MSERNELDPIIGQEAITPDGLGRVAGYWTEICGGLSIEVETYVRNRSCKWAAHNVELIDPRGPQKAPPPPTTRAVSRSEADEMNSTMIPLATLRDHLHFMRDDAATGVVFVFDDILEWLDDLAEDGS